MKMTLEIAVHKKLKNLSKAKLDPQILITQFNEIILNDE